MSKETKTYYYYLLVDKQNGEIMDTAETRQDARNRKRDIESIYDAKLQIIKTSGSEVVR